MDRKRAERLRREDKKCPRCGLVIVGSGGFLSVATYLHSETPGECVEALAATPVERETKLWPIPVPSQKDIDDLRVATAHDMVVTTPAIVLYLLSLLPVREP